MATRSKVPAFIALVFLVVPMIFVLRGVAGMVDAAAGDRSWGGPIILFLFGIGLIAAVVAGLAYGRRNSVHDSVHPDHPDNADDPAAIARKMAESARQNHAPGSL